MSGDDMTVHLTVMEAAAYVDHSLEPHARARVAGHLVECDACRAEVIAVARVTRRGRWPRWVRLAPLAAAAAAIVLYLAPWQREGDIGSPPLREPAVTMTAAPTPLIPQGEVAGLRAMTWSSVPHADRYQITLFEGDGAVVWRVHTADTTVSVPATVRLAGGVPYYWKVAARVESGRWVSSDLTAFTLAQPSIRQ